MRLLVGQRYIIQVRVVGILSRIPVHLEIDCDAIPIGRGPVLKGPVQVRSLTIERDRLVRHVVIRSTLHFDRDVIPGVAVWVTGNSRLHPFRVLVITNVPLIPGGNAAFVAKNKSHSAEELVNVELERLRGAEVVDIKIDIVGEVVHRWNQAAVAVERSLRR